ncbi:unnamed protein product [Toxocara canis]|uniref:C2H2-type domain-containing protein n=1 Tax=Toxocara canis TaxID=6265 RepID=A0A3P7GQ03_TOXCA|nr:unnamed protein product [Toxocara canis]
MYLSQLAALSGQCSQGSSDNSPSSSSTTVTSSATNTAPTCPLSPMGEQQAAASSIAEVTQAALNAISMASLSGAAANNPSSTPGAASQNGEPATSSSAGSDMPNWLAGLMPQAAVAASAANSMQTAQNSITPPNPSVPSLLEQMQLMGAAQMMSGGGATASASNPLGGQPLNALAAALSQAPASTTAPPLTPNSAAALLAATGNYGSPAKDAYCELCDKNFCNRYFLKTHRQKKHGITDDSCSPMKSFPASPGAQLAGLPFQPSSQLGALVPPATSLALGTAAIAAMQLPANLAALMAACGTAVPSSSAGPHSAPAATPPSQLSSASLNQSTSVIVNGSSTGSPNAKLIKLETNEQDSAGVAEDIDDDGSEGKPKSPTENLLSAQISASPAGELPSTCDLCNKSFPTLFSLLAHKAREHMPLGSANLTSAENTMQAQRSPVKSAQSPGDDEKIACEMCEKEFESRHYLQQHILIHHSGIANASSLLGSFLPAGLPLPFMLPPTLPQNFQMSDNEQANLLAGINAQINTPQPKQAVKRQYSSSGKNYCDLCNKEVCNKYFLRTHMLKMHGIVIDENKTVIANIDTLEKEKMGAISFRCDICMAELKSRHLLRSHKQEAHGVVPIHTPPTGGQSRTPKHSSTSTPNVFSTTQTPVINGQLADKGSESCASGEEWCGIIAPRLPPQLYAGGACASPPHPCSFVNAAAVRLAARTCCNCARPDRGFIHEKVATGPHFRLASGHLVVVNYVTRFLKDVHLGWTSMLSALSIGTEIGTEMCAVQRFSQRFMEDFEIAMRLACVLDPTTMRQTERCPVCELRCKSAAQLQEHVQEKHGADLSSEILESFQKVAQEKVALLMRAQQQAVQALQQQVQQAQQAVGAYKCHLCADSFNDEVQRHMHVIHKHHNELRLKRMDSAHTPVTDGSASPLKGGIDGDVVKCPQPLCDFRTQRAENLAIHLQRHAPLDAALNALQRQRAEVIADGTATANPEEDDEDEAMRATTEVALKMAKENEQKPCPCPIATCQRRYHDINALEKHIAKVHRWQLKLSPKKHTNGIISPSKIVKLTKRYTCQFSKCHQRFATKQLCREHVLSHFRAPVPERAEEGSDSGRAEPSSSSEFVGSMDSYVREEQEHVVKDIHEHLARRESRKEHERNSHTSGSMSPVLEQVVPEGFARPLDSVSQKPYMLQSFIMREQSTSAGGTAYAKGNGGVVHEMIAHLPVRTLLTEPVLMTVELVPAPHIDAQVMHV